MNPWLVLLTILGLCAVVAVGVGAAAFLSFRRPWRVRCPRDGVESQLQVDALDAAKSEVTGARRVSVARCSHRPPLTGCDQACLDLPAGTRHVATPADPPLPVAGTPTVLVPLDGTQGSEAALPAARQLARIHGARVRLLRVLPPTTTLRDADDYVVAYSDQEAAREEYAARWYMRRLRSRLPDVPVDEVVRFGEPTAEILSEAEAPDVAWITMATRPARGLRRWLRRSVTRTVQRAAWVPVMSTPYRTSGQA
jgi:nucleotide-binding universal stress UspA family protein